MLNLKKIGKVIPTAEGKQETGAKLPQGISAQGNALRQTVVLALLVALVPAVLGFGYLLAVREPTIERRQLEQVAASLAAQQAQVVHRTLVGLKERLESAANSPLALSAIGSRSEQDIVLVERAMLDYFPEVLSLRVFPIGDMGTSGFAGSTHGLRNHIEVDLVRRTSEGEKIEPQAYEFEDQWMTSIATRVVHPRIADRDAVIIITVDNKAFARGLSHIEKDAGRFDLEQVYIPTTGKPKVNVIASRGRASGDSIVQRSDIPNTSWRVAFTPSPAARDRLDINTLSLYLVLAASILAIIGGALLVLRRFPKRLEEEVHKVVEAADKKSGLVLAVPELVVLAKSLRRATLRALRQGTAPASRPGAAADEPLMQAKSAEMANPMFQATGILVEEEALDLDLDESGEAVLAQAGGASGLPDHIFRAYDIRGHANDELSDSVVAKIGKAVGTIAGDAGEQALIVGCDGRNSSPRIKSALIRALMESGRDVIDIGLVPTPLLYFATRHLNFRSGIMVTGSHNPADHNGLKIVLKQETIAAGGIQHIRNKIVEGQFTSGNGRMTREDIIPAYIDEVLQDIAIAVPLKIVIDAGSGATGEIAPGLFEELGCEVIPLHCKIDGNFPHHPPDTSNEENLADLIQAVQENTADFGVAFDGDGDRLAVVTAKGDIVRSDVLLMIFAQDVVSRNPGADVVFDVKCSRNLTDMITRNGGRPVLWKTGHAFMKEKMRETAALLGGEFSGHIFFGERWFGFDDGMYAAARLAEVLSTHGNALHEVIDEFPSSVNTPEIIIPVDEDKKFDLIERIVNGLDFGAGKVTTMDGIRVDFDHGWGLIRASNTVPALTARFEADTAANLEIIQDEFREQIALIDPQIELNF